jgi:hypothetical protein
MASYCIAIRTLLRARILRREQTPWRKEAFLATVQAFRLTRAFLRAAGMDSAPYSHLRAGGRARKNGLVLSACPPASSPLLLTIKYDVSAILARRVNYLRRLGMEGRVAAGGRRKYLYRRLPGGDGLTPENVAQNGWRGWVPLRWFMRVWKRCSALFRQRHRVIWLLATCGGDALAAACYALAGRSCGGWRLAGYWRLRPSQHHCCASSGLPRGIRRSAASAA